MPKWLACRDVGILRGVEVGQGKLLRFLIGLRGDVGRLVVAQPQARFL